jgi:hypothetical protein
MQQSQTGAADSSTYSTQQVADLLAVVMWADRLLGDEVVAALHRARLGLNLVIHIESLLVSLRPVAKIRIDLAKLDGEQLLDGFEVWAARQRAVMNRLASSSLGRE